MNAGSSPHHFYQTPSVRIRLSLVISVFALISVSMLVRSTWLQLIHDPKLESLGRRQFESKILTKPRRGLILDRTDEPLAINLETSSLAGNPQKILKSRATLHLLAHALNVNPLALKKRLDSKKSFFWIERHLSDERMDKLRTHGIIQGNGDMPEGLWIVKEMKRVYPHGELASSLLGSVNVDTEGLEPSMHLKMPLVARLSSTDQKRKPSTARASRSASMLHFNIQSKNLSKKRWTALNRIAAWSSSWIQTMERF